MQTQYQLIQEAISKFKERNAVKDLTTPTLVDYHIHTKLSRDAPTATLQGYIKKAEEVGVKEIAFTNHLIVSGEDQITSIRLHEIPGHLEEIWRAQDDTEVILKTGFEVDYFPDQESKISSIIDNYDLDYVLGSVHQINGKYISVTPTEANSFFRNRNPTDAIEEYYKRMKLAIESELFDVISHPDYFRKHYPNPIEWSKYGETVYEVISTLKSYGTGYEVNTSGYRHGIDDKFPCDGFIEAAQEAGVKTVTLGSDSHYCGTLGYGIIEAAKLLKTMGYKTASTFNARKENRLKIENILNNYK